MPHRVIGAKGIKSCAADPEYILPSVQAEVTDWLTVGNISQNCHSEAKMILGSPPARPRQLESVAWHRAIEAFRARNDKCSNRE